ncbi:hypothetical protein FQR65_LT08232 [Abscondita terminalis]|nr:hypothetical protein FQR65_LT08232 [Abscondita terminalis]
MSLRAWVYEKNGFKALDSYNAKSKKSVNEQNVSNNIEKLNYLIKFEDTLYILFRHVLASFVYGLQLLVGISSSWIGF